MKTMYADFNAMTESDGIRLTTIGSQADIRRLGVQVGDWVWLTDGELVVGARVDQDFYYGTIGVPDWKTLVYLDDDDARDDQRVWGELQASLARTSGSAADETRIFDLLTQFDHYAAPSFRDQRPGYLAFRRAAALLAMGKAELGLIEIAEARASRPGHPPQDFLYLELLRRTSPGEAEVEARQFARSEEAAAIVLVAAINILADRAEELADDQLVLEAERVIQLCDQFERAPGRSNISASQLSLVHFNRGMMLLRLGRLDEARAAIDLAHAIEPLDPSLIKATRLGLDGSNAREIASKVRSRPRTAA